MSETTPIRYRIHPDAAWQRSANEVFVVTADNRLHNLRDEVSVALWSALVPHATLDALVDAVVQDFDVSPDVAREDTRAFLEDAEERALIQRVP